MGMRGPGHRGWMALPAALAAGLALVSCFFDSERSEPSAPAQAFALDYSVRIVSDSTGGGSASACRIGIRIRSWPESSPRLFQLPVYYPDNPRMALQGLKAADLAVEDAAGKALAARDTLLPDGDRLDGNFAVLPPNAVSVSYAIDHDPADPSRFGLPLPGLAKGVDLIDGAYFFALPVLGRDFATQWRNQARLSLDFDPGPGKSLYGMEPSQTFASNYGLMFVRGALNPIKTRSFTMANHEVTSYATSSDSIDLDAFNVLLERCIRLVEDSLLTLPTYRYHVGENPVFWGIEGMQGYWFREEARQSALLHIHEIVHTFVGVYHSDLEDPWWKEGMTNYLGELLSLQTGLHGDTVFAAGFLRRYDTLPSARAHALASPHVRTRLFLPLDSAFKDVPDRDDFIGLVYGKGAQASMILDRYLLEGSSGRHSVFDLVRDLIRRHGNAFDRAQLQASVDRLAGGNSGAFLAGLLDEPTPFGADSLVNTYAALRALGRFGPAGGKLPVPGVDGPVIAAPAAKRAQKVSPDKPWGSVVPPGSKF